MNSALTDNDSNTAPEAEFEQWLARLRAADTLAENEFFAMFGPRIERICSNVLGNLPQQAGAIVSPESKALSAIRSVMMGVRAGRFESLDNQTSLLRLLITIASRKCHDAQRAHYAEIRGGGRLKRASDLQDADSRQDALEQFACILETPEFVVAMQERCEGLMKLLKEKDRLIAQKRLEGYTEQEIADLMGIARRTVQMHIKDIREIWSAALDE